MGHIKTNKPRRDKQGKPSIAELRAVGVKDTQRMLDLMGIEWSTYYNAAGEEMLGFEDEKIEGYLSTNAFIVTMNTGYDGSAAGIAGTFRYGLKRGFLTVEDLPKVISPEILPIIKDVLKGCPLEWPDGKIQTLDERGIRI